ncbi:GNAT family N-acetyltransferase [Rhizobiaceae bacterium n13]|uniref:GNAT family N-acetyltransferase n=1 Tax=Ferirhizobium litorale TaxID=2927786 RepID=A0AAE3QEM2_9HYPH|nr:GNAT family N-acetyltransferase [Fererhizobium litorale]MDI7864060.1 GNAT family N-acetyltransferase [Fererhizobium litorale]MDI7924457.1 GNAT family N-acetyltransferase [Fererhizobium litorale]
MTITIACEPPRQAAVIRLLELSDIYASSLYPAESNHMLDLTSLEGDEVTFFVARHGETIVGCCALVDAGDGTAEIKRMFVDPDARGLKIGRKLLEILEDRARDMGLRAIRLETGIRQPEAIGLYSKFGYGDIEPFGDYKPDPLSIFMEKRIAAA